MPQNTEVWRGKLLARPLTGSSAKACRSISRSDLNGWSQSIHSHRGCHAEAVLPAEKTERAARALWDVDTLSEVRELMPLLTS